MPPRIVIHAGFHKTGTTSVQATLRANRSALRPCLRFVLRPKMVALCEAARAYSISRSRMDLGLVQYEAAELARDWATSDRPILLSSEDLCGHMPGRRGLRSYDAAPRLLQALTDALAEAVPDAEQIVVLTTRAPEAWLRSCYVQHLRATPITQSVEDYARDYAASADLMAVVDQCRATLSAAKVEALDLAACSDMPLGPLDALLTVVGDIPRTDLSPLPPANTSPPPAMIDAMLALNRSDLSNEARKAAKAALRRTDF